MSDSIHIFQRYVGGDSVAADDLFYRYVDRLTRLARSRLSANLARRVDAEDIVMSAYRSFFVGARDGQFLIEQGGELWSLLVRITLNKLYRTAASHNAQKRAMNRDVAIFDVADPQPSATDAIALADEVKLVMQQLSPDRQRILELRLQGELLEDIATIVGVSERTVRRALQEVRERLIEVAGLPSDWNQPAARVGSQAKSAKTTLPEATLRYSDYVLEEQIGMGGMGRVYRATRKADGATVAVKYLRKSFLNQPSAVQRFAEEAGTVTALQHSNIVGVQGFGKTDAGGFFIAMDYVVGRNLAERCDEKLEPQVIKQWMLQLCSALAHAHSQGVIHCDLKPANILIRDDGTALLTDFGLSRRMNDQSKHGEFAGTAPYMAPEQIDSALGRIDPTTDVYGLGAVLFHLCTQQPPFAGERLVDVMSHIVTRDTPLLPSDLNPGATTFDPICERCLCRQEDRFANMEELSNAIRQI